MFVHICSLEASYEMQYMYLIKSNMNQQEEVQLDLNQAMAAISKVAEQHDQKQMMRIKQIYKIVTEGETFGNNCIKYFKIFSAKSRLQKVISAKREKANNNRLLVQLLDNHIRKHQSMEMMMKTDMGQALKWLRKGSSVVWVRTQSPSKE